MHRDYWKMARATFGHVLVLACVLGIYALITAMLAILSAITGAF